jgi:hypothetical protein
MVLWCLFKVFSWIFLGALMLKGHQIRQLDPFGLISTEEGERVLERERSLLRYMLAVVYWLDEQNVIRWHFVTVHRFSLSPFWTAVFLSFRELLLMDDSEWAGQWATAVSE